MHAINDRDQFAPPRPPGRMRAVSLAVLAHVLLLGALTWGVKWKTSADQPAVEAELWSAIPQQAAPREVPPPPPPAPEPTPTPAPVPAPPPPAPPPRVQPDTHEADIAIERQKKKLEEEKKRQQQLEREKEREKERKEEERRERLEQEKKERLQKEKAEKEQKLADQKKAEQEKQKKLAEDKRKAEADAKRVEDQRQANLRRMQGLAGATGGETATGKDKDTRGPSGGYGGKVAAKVKPNIVYPDAISGNPRAEIEVRAAPDGTIVGRRILQSSGNKAWDDAVLRALDKTETLPRDVDGRVPSSLVIGFRPQD